MSLDDWILALHLLSAFSLVAAMILFWVVVVALRAAAGPDPTLVGLVRAGNVAIGIGLLGTLVFGLWLAISLDAYEIWDGWVLAALVLWAVGTETGRRAGAAVGPDPGAAGREARRRALVLHGLSSLAVLLLLADMIWKPGA